MAISSRLGLHSGKSSRLSRARILAFGFATVMLWLALGAAAWGESIHQAAASGNATLVIQLLEKDPTLVSAADAEYGATPLHWAAAKGQVEMVSLLLEKGANLEARNGEGRTPLQVAVLSRKGTVVANLLEKGAAVNAADPEGNTALHLAATMGRKEIVELLLGAQADPNLKNAAGLTPRDRALAKGEPEVAALLDHSGRAPKTTAAKRTGGPAAAAGSFPIRWVTPKQGGMEMMGPVVKRPGEYDLAVESVGLPGGVLEKDRLVCYTAPGAPVAIEVKLRYVAKEATKIAGNVEPDTGEYFKAHPGTDDAGEYNQTVHFDTETRPGYHNVTGSGELTFTLQITAPAARGRYEKKLMVGEFTPEDSPLGQWVTIWIAKHPFVLAVGETPPATEAQAGSAGPSREAAKTEPAKAETGEQIRRADNVPMTSPSSKPAVAAETQVANGTATAPKVPGPEVWCNWASQPPVIDGVAEMAEWMNVDSFNLPHGHFRVQNDLTNLYLLLEVTDDTTDDPPKPGGGPPWPDYFRLVWDVNGDGERTPNVDVMYGVRGDTGALALYRLLWEGATTTARETAATFARGFSSSPGAGRPHGYWEFALPLRELGFDGPPQREPGRLPRHVGLGLRVYSARPSFTDDIPPSLERDFHGAFEVFLALPPGGLAAPPAESAGAPQTPAPIQPRPKVVVKLSNEPGEVSGPANPSDDFEDGVIDVAKWEPHSLPGTNVEESGGRLMMTMGPTTEGVDRGGEVYSKWVLRGPFDVQVDYELIEWPDHNRASVGLFLDLTDDQWSLQRLSARVGTWDGTDETYCTHFSSMHGGKCEGMMATSHRKGTLRLIRDEGSVLSAYVRSPENDGWMLVNSAQMPQVDAKPLLALFGELDPRTVKVAFDTFQTNRGQVVPPGTPTDEQPETRQQRNP